MTVARAQVRGGAAVLVLRHDADRRRQHHHGRARRHRALPVQDAAHHPEVIEEASDRFLILFLIFGNTFAFIVEAL